MAPSKSADLLLHPVRLQILQTLLGGRELTTAEIGSELPDIPAATLYRHIGTLAKAGALEVVRERPVRGTLERTYRLELARASVADDELTTMTPEEHRRAFTGFVAGLLQSFDRYLDGPAPDLKRDGAGYRQTGLWLDDDELAGLVAKIQGAVADAAAKGPGEGRRRRILSTVLIPTGPED